ncbi:MAG: helix-turn-helix transcriptional regulator [Clostridia bacterium]|nr:helix-turn-helix transcriptional regulator [Clostridia bacterium]MBO5257127.1 helix-turn-helix transcriptional regulator [Clostridia bacterium]MBP3292313.1 helix-turn-helix transcriptional regulator [Clostridia bacterium]
MAVQYPRLRDLREDFEMTQEQVANYLDIKRQQYSRYEIGINDIPTRILIRLAYLYNTSIDYLLGMTNNPKPYKDIEE